MEYRLFTARTVLLNKSRDTGRRVTKLLFIGSSACGQKRKAEERLRVIPSSPKAEHFDPAVLFLARFPLSLVAGPCKFRLDLHARQGA